MTPADLARRLALVDVAHWVSLRALVSPRDYRLHWIVAVSRGCVPPAEAPRPEAP